MAELRDIMIGIVVGLAVLIGFMAFYTDMAGHYGVTTNTTWMNTYNSTYDEMNSLASKQMNKTAGSSISESSVFATMSRGAYTAMKTTLAVPRMIINMLTDVSNRFNLPTWFVSMVITIISLLLIWAIISAVFRYKT